MWKSIVDWALALIGMARELQSHRSSIRRLEERVRDLEETLRLLSHEYRHSRELEAAEREKLLLRIEAAVLKQPIRSRKKRK